MSTTPADASSPPLFPLGMTPLERYFVSDARPGYPMTFPLFMDLEGELDREALEAAFHTTLTRHPLLMATRSGKRQWSPATQPQQIEWMDTNGTSQDLEDFHDLKQKPGLRLKVHVSPGRARLCLLLHHATCDGLGGLEFLGDLLAEYSQRVPATQPPTAVSEVDPEMLRQRTWFDVTVPHAVSTSVVLKAAAGEAWRLFSRRPEYVEGSKQSAPSRATDLPVATLSAEEFSGLRNLARQRGINTHDLLLRDAFLVLREWNDEHLKRPMKGWLRINVPMSLRGKRDKTMPAANLLGYAMITRRAEVCEDGDAFLQNLADETKFMRDWATGALFAHGLSVVTSVPGLLAGITNFHRRIATMVLSHLGDPVHRFHQSFPEDDGDLLVGNLRITNIYGVPPIRPGTRIAIMMSSFGGRLTMAINADPRWFDPALAERFLDAYAEKLRGRLRETSETGDQDATATFSDSPAAPG